jgi:hypothetical protein
MDKTLTQILAECDEIQTRGVRGGVIMRAGELEDCVVQLHSNIKIIQSVARHLADVANAVNELILYRNAASLSNSNFRTPNVHPSENDHIALRNGSQDRAALSSTTKLGSESRAACELARGVAINVPRVPTMHNVPLNYIYYVEDIKQYVFSLGGLYINGNLGAIYDSKSTAHIRTVGCRHGAHCKSIAKGLPCQYYHEPYEMRAICKKNNIPADAMNNILETNVYNFASGGWLYTTNKRTAANKSMRHVGGRSTIAYDLEIIRGNPENFQNEIQRRKSQLIHDALILTVLLQNKLICERDG